MLRDSFSFCPGKSHFHFDKTFEFWSGKRTLWHFALNFQLYSFQMTANNNSSQFSVLIMNAHLLRERNPICNWWRLKFERIEKKQNRERSERKIFERLFEAFFSNAVHFDGHRLQWLHLATDFLVVFQQFHSKCHAQLSLRSSLASISDFPLWLNVVCSWLQSLSDVPFAESSMKYWYLFGNESKYEANKSISSLYIRNGVGVRIF